MDKDVQSSVDFWGVASGQAVLKTFWNAIAPQDGTGILWNPQSTGGGSPFAIWKLVSTPWFCRFARYTSRLTYELNAYAKTAVNQLAIFALGAGFKYSSEVAAVQERLDQFEKVNRWHRKSQDYMKAFLIDGECWLSIHDGFKVRWVDPDEIYGDNTEAHLQDGIVRDPEDQQTATGYMRFPAPDRPLAEGRMIAAEDIQHRANKVFPSQPRGYPWLLPVLKDLSLVDPLGCDLLASARLLAQHAVIRRWQAPQKAVEGIATMPGWKNALGGSVQSGGIDPDGPKVVDTNKETEWKILESQDYAQFTEVIDVALRKVAALCNLSSGIFSQAQSERGAYASEIVHSSWAAKAIESMQNMWLDHDKELFEMVGIDPDKVEATMPQVGEPEKKAETEWEKMAIEKGIVSRQYIAEKHNVDWECEHERIQQEREEFGDPNGADGEGNPELDGGQSGPE